MKMLFLTSLLLLSACTTSVYKPFDDLIGYSDEVVDREQGIYKIGYVGHEWITNSKAEQEKVIDYTLLRSAEVALLNGFRFFIIIENNSEARKILKNKITSTISLGSAILPIGTVLFNSSIIGSACLQKAQPCE